MALVQVGKKAAASQSYSFLTLRGDASGGYYHITGSNITYVYAAGFPASQTVVDGTFTAGSAVVVGESTSNNCKYGSTANIAFDSFTSNEVVVHFIGGTMQTCQAIVCGENVQMTYSANP